VVVVVVLLLLLEEVAPGYLKLALLLLLLLLLLLVLLLLLQRLLVAAGPGVCLQVRRLRSGCSSCRLLVQLELDTHHLQLATPQVGSCIGCFCSRFCRVHRQL
jgi:hypothetical protein